MLVVSYVPSRGSSEGIYAIYICSAHNDNSKLWSLYPTQVSSVVADADTLPCGVFGSLGLVPGGQGLNLRLVHLRPKSNWF